MTVETGDFHPKAKANCKFNLQEWTLRKLGEAIAELREAGVTEGKKSNPLETHAGRVHRIGLTVKSFGYGCIVCVVFLAFVFTVDLLDRKRWVPLAQSVCLLISTLLCLMSLTAPPREPEADLSA